MIRIVIAEDHIIVAEGLRSLLNSVKGLNIVKTVENGKVLIEYIKNNPVDLVIMDGLEATYLIKKDYPQIKILILSVSHKPLHIQSALDAGVEGYLLKETNKNEVVDAIYLLMEGKTFYAQSVTKSLIGKNAQSKIKLTEREIEILALLAEGDSAKEIAISLNIGENTVKTYRNNLFRKFKVKKTIVLATKAIQGGYL